MEQYEVVFPDTCLAIEKALGDGKIRPVGLSNWYVEKSKPC
jgi:hypothetical protein